MALVRFGRTLLPSYVREFFGEDFLAPFFGEERAWYPEVDVYEDQEGLTLEAEVPGVRKEDLKVEYSEGVLTISGQRKEERRREERGYVAKERRFGEFCRSFRIGEAFDAERIKATYQDGVLKVQIPRSKKPEAEVRRIPVE